MEIDYGKVGLRCGLEIHQQLDTSKLFCKCPSLLRKDEPDFKIKRRLHAVAGESGEVDIAAAHEATKEKEFTYEGYHDNCCLVDYDESPPGEINKEALKTTLHIALLLNCKILPISQIMRKTVIDGSNTSGFQRTVLIARDGWIETSKEKVGIATLCLEEDSARIIDKEKAIFRLDRLGIPLVEIATDAEIKTPKQAKEVALKLGEILRTLKVKRGLGTIRQDVNLSVTGGKRIELKGFQDVRNIERAIEIEVKRQIDLIKKGKSIAEVRAVNPDGSSRFLRPLPGAARMYPETDIPILKISRDMIDGAKKELLKMEKPEEELEKQGLSREMISLLLKRKKIEEFKELLNVVKKPQLIAKTILIFPKEIASKEKKSLDEIEKILNIDVLANVLEKVKKGKILESEVKHILERIVKGEGYEKSVKIRKADINFIEEKISQIIKEKPGLSVNAYMGIVMKEFKGKISGNEASEMIRKHIK